MSMFTSTDVQQLKFLSVSEDSMPEGAQMLWNAIGWGEQHFVALALGMFIGGWLISATSLSRN